MSKYNLTVTINKKLLEKARKHKINISSFLEIRLNEYIALLEGNTKNYDYDKIKSEINDLIINRGENLKSRSNKS